MGAVGYARRFANLPTAAEYQERHPNVELLTFEQASEHTGRKIASLKSSLNKVSNRLVPVALTVFPAPAGMSRGIMQVA